MNKCRILTPEDAGLIPAYLSVLRSGIDSIANLYPPGKSEEFKAEYTPESLRPYLVQNPERRLLAHFSGNSLDGILIEGFDTISREQEFTINRTLIKWIVAGTTGFGIGSRLIEDCIARAITERKDLISLAVSSKNDNAERLYQRLGFQADGHFDEDRMLLMHFLINPALRLKQTI